MLRGSRVRLVAASTGAFDPTTLLMRKQAHVRYALHTSPYTVITTSGFVSLCRHATQTVEEQMTHSEAIDYLQKLHAARIVVFNAADDIVHLRPFQLLAHATTTVTQGPIVEAFAAAVDAVLDAKKARKAAVWRRRFWSTVAVGSGTQMAVMSYLTFVAYDWDTMEPASYFLTSGTALGFFMYFVLLRREHTLTDVDRTSIANRYAITRKATPSLEAAVRHARSDEDDNVREKAGEEADAGHGKQEAQRSGNENDNDRKR
jgi:hypothetical protein